MGSAVDRKRMPQGVFAAVSDAASDLLKVLAYIEKDLDRAPSKHKVGLTTAFDTDMFKERVAAHPVYRWCVIRVSTNAD